MIDAHVHIERGPYSFDWIMKFIESAQMRGISELTILEHSHRFIDFKPIYESILNHSVHGKYQSSWFNKRCSLNLSDYTNFIEETKSFEFPIKIKFGLEICYFEDQLKTIEELVTNFDWDCRVGSIHWIDGWGFDHPKNADYWKEVDINDVYIRYYESMINLCNSGLFDILAHPDSIKCLGFYPSMDLSTPYNELSKSLNDHQMNAEFSCGLKINYQHFELGPNRELLNSFLSNKVKLVTATDAHRPEDVGLYIDEANNIIKNS